MTDGKWENSLGFQDNLVVVKILFIFILNLKIIKKSLLVTKMKFLLQIINECYLIKNKENISILWMV